MKQQRRAQEPGSRLLGGVKAFSQFAQYEALT
jgi:hypothetical protein